MRRSIAVALLALAWSAVARADIPPPPGYVEQCTIDKACKKGEEGDDCRAWHGDTTACEKKHAKDGFEYRCRTSGASVWSEVWCRPKSKKK